MSTRLALSAVIVGNVAALMGMVPVAAVLPTLASEFRLSVQDASLVMTAFLLMVAALVLIAGRLGDLLGYRQVFSAGVVLYTAGALLSALAAEFWQLIASRALSGVGVALLTGTSAAIIISVVSADRRGRALSLLTMAGPAGSVIGVGLAPFILANLSWRWIFLMIAPLALLSLVAARGIPAAPPAAGRRVDVPGGLLLFGALAAFSLSFNHFHDGPDTFEDGWTWHVPTHVLATALFLAFLWTERRMAQPLLDVRVLRERAIAISVGCHGVVHMTMLAAVFLVPFFVQNALGLTPAHVAIVIVVTNGLASVSSLLGGWVWDRLRSPLVRPVCMAVLATGLLLTAIWVPYLTFTTFLALQVMLGLGMGVANTLNYTIALGASPGDQRGFVTGLLETTRQTGHTLAVVLAAAVLGAGRADGTALLQSFQVAWLLFGLIAAGGALLAALPQRQPEPVRARTA
ncbi:MAG: MFS transporter [Chloroflexi bacterium]|nr:MFS transporter [Chloroflexota bacterium]